MNKIKFFKTLIELLSTYFYIGYLPAAGTFATIAALPIVILVQKVNNVFLQIVFVLIFCIYSIIISTYAEELFKNKDDKKIVVDEIAGFLVATLGINIISVKTLIILLVIFRVIDITKIGLKNVQKLSSGIGVVADDIVSGVLTNLIYRIICLLN